MPSRSALARCVPFAIFIALLMLSSMVRDPWLVAVRALIVAAALGWFWREYTELARPSAVALSQWMLAVAVGFAVFIAWIWLDQDWATISRSQGFVPLRDDGALDWPLVLLRLAGFALVVPVMEELFWRSFLLRWLERHDFLALAPRSVGVRAFVITMVLFAVEHNQWLAGAVAALAYGVLYMRSGNLWLPIAAHALTNAALGVWIVATRNWQFW